ncbi:WH1-domain-containing protein, partial [Punctularia strigosozonata HHB-11173 SS5]|uniref:WH1-domain-containing protein n=1 Tax=Punctularia strigosozonata (strain HHB-11173) TaxID=741275 RepID=UPI000441822E
MPAQTTLTNDEKGKIKSAVPSSMNKIHTAAFCRIYYAHPDPNQWSYAGLQGALVFCRDNQKNTWCLRMVDLQGTRGVIWEHELYDGFEYWQDRPFFHSFAGDECMIGVVFADEGEAKVFYKKITNRKEVKPGKAKSSGKSKKATKGSKIDKSMISGPIQGSYIHVAHMGYDSDKGFTSSNVDPSWLTLLNQLESMGVDKSVIEKDMDFIKNFMRDAQKAQPAPAEKKKPPPPPVPRRGTHAHHESAGSTAAAPPPPPPSRSHAAPRPPSRPPAPPTRSGPPPPPSRPASAAPTSPPPPPARPTTAAPPPPPPPPARPTGTAPPPPPPPPPPISGGAPPPPPPPP